MKKLFVFIAIIAFSMSVSAQNKYSVLTGKVSIKGTATPGVTIVLSGPKLMGQRTVVTDANGIYRFALLPSGSGYQFKATLDGFQPFVRKNITLILGNTSSINFQLQESNVTEEIVVTAEAPLVDTKSSSTTSNLTTDFVDKIVTDRQMQMVMSMVPGAVEGNNPSMLGGTDTDNVYMVDGADNTDPLTGTWGTALNFDALDEIQVVTGNASAEFGRATGAVVNLVTKSGGNEFHGNMRFLKSDVDWNSETDGKPFGGDPLASSRYTTEDRWSFTVGGPIIKDKLWFFTTYELRDKTRTTQHYATVEDWLTKDSSLMVDENPSYKGHYFSVKLTYQLNDNHNFQIMYNEDPIEFNNYSYRAYTNYENPNMNVQQQGGENLYFEWNWMVSNSGALSFKYQSKDSPLSIVPVNTEAIATVNRPHSYYYDEYWSSFHPALGGGTATQFQDSVRKFDLYNLKYSHFLDTAWGSHDIKVGVEYKDTETSFIYHWGGGFDANGNSHITEFVTPYYNAYGPGYSFYYNEIQDTAKPQDAYEKYTGLYLQDDWGITDRLTLNIGLRAEEVKQENADRVEVVKQKFGDMFAPRFGIAYDMDGDKISASYSRYYDAIGTYAVNAAQPDLGMLNWVAYHYLGDVYPIGDPNYTGFNPWSDINDWNSINYADHPELWERAPWWDYQDLFGGSIEGDLSALKPAYMDEMTLGYEKQFAELYSMGVKYFNRKWKDQYEDKDWDQNGLDEIFTVPGTYRKYTAFMLTFNKKLGNDGFTFLGSYTYSKTEGYAMSDQTSGYYDTPYNVFNRYGKVGDIPHQFKFNGSYTFDFGLVIGLNYLWQSGSVYSKWVTVENELGQGSANALADVLGSERMSSYKRADLHVEYEFSIKSRYKFNVYVDIFNFLNDRSVLGVDSTYGTGHYDTTAEAGSDEYNAYVSTHAPVIDSLNDNFGVEDAWSFPRSYYFGINFEF